jgi:hypothetical protein
MQMITKLDPARKGMAFIALTEDERQFVLDAPVETVIRMDGEGIWEPYHRSDFPVGWPYWTEWERPAEPEQPANLPEGFVARKLSRHEDGRYDIDGATMSTTGTYLHSTTSLKATHVRVGHLHGDDFVSARYTKEIMSSSLEIPTVAKWAILRKLPEVTK